jgi:LPS-assembly protein
VKRPTDWLTFTPVAGGRFTYYSALDGPRSDYTRGLGEVGFDAELHASGTWDYRNKFWKIDGLRHLFTPEISYRYIPQADKGTAYIPPIDAQTFSTYLQPLELGDLRNIDQLSPTNTLRFALNNTLQTRDSVYGSRDLVRLNVANDFLFDRAAGQRAVSEIRTELGVMPARWLELGVYQSFAPQDLTLSELNTAVTLRSGEDWAARFMSNFLRHTVDDYYFEGTYRLNEAYEAVTQIRYDVRAARFDEQVYGIRQNLGNTWRVEYAITLYDGPRRESRFGFNFRVDALRF